MAGSMIDKSKTIVIIGATGLLGRKIVETLQVKGYKPLVATRNPAKASKIFGENVDSFSWNGSDVEVLKQNINACEGVVNLAGESIAKRWTEKSKKQILDSRVNITKAIVDAINSCEEPPEVLIQASAIGYYPNDSFAVMDEQGRMGGGFLARVVKQWEDASINVDNRVRRVIIRTGVVLSPDGGFLKNVLPSIKSFLGGWFGNGEQMISWIHIDDHANAVCFLLDNKMCIGTYNLVSPNPVKLKALLSSVGRILRRPVWLPIPTFILKLMFGEMAGELLLANQTVSPKKLIDSGFIFSFEDIDSALKDLLH